MKDLNRRKFLATTATAAGVITLWRPLLFARDILAEPNKANLLDLSGRWDMTQVGKEEWIPACVPGCVHTDLMAAGKIADPYYQDNERSIQWIAESNWVFRRKFQVSDELLQNEQVHLCCDGLDTLATVRLNGQEIGRANNMFRVWEFDVKPVLQSGENVIEITFASPLPVMQKGTAERAMYEWIGPHEPKGRAYVRKQPCSFGWDWGPVLASCGIWRAIGIHAFNYARLTDFLVRQDHSQPGVVRLDVDVDAEIVSHPARFQAVVSVCFKNKVITSKKADISAGHGSISLEVKNPKLWWPAGMGEQPLYEVQVELLDQDGKPVDRMTKRIGLRTLKILPPTDKVSLRFAVNGVEFFSKGANCIPMDSFANRVTPEIMRRYVTDAIAANMNTLRFWGGGYYEEDALFNICDELGVCVWLDFKFACSTYPVFDDSFTESVRLEVRDNLRRLRHHACIAVWCGNNEISLMVKAQWSDHSMGRADYDKLFKDLIGAQVEELAPQTDYVSGSPDCGDIHYWGVWHEDKPFEIYRTVDGFMSEFGFQSFPHPKTIESFTTESDRASVLTPVMKWHQRAHGDGNQLIVTTIKRYFNEPKDFESTIWLSQILQAYGIKMGAEHWRQSMPKSMGCIFWQFNDCWPSVSWSSVDHAGRWKALHYVARKFYEPILVSGVENATKGTVDIHISSDQQKTRQGTLTWQVTDLSGKSLASDAMDLEITPQASRLVKTLDLNEHIQKTGSANVLMWLKLIVNGKTVSENFAALVRPKDWKLIDPELNTSVQREGDGFVVTVKSKRPAFWTWLDLAGVDATFSDNFFHIGTDATQTVLVRPAQRLSKDDFIKELKVRSLFDTYLHA